MPNVPPPTAKLWDMLVSGRKTHKFGLFAANMAVARAVRIVEADPARKPAAIAELCAFFEKYAAMTADDLQKLI